METMIDKEMEAYCHIMTLEEEKEEARREFRNGIPTGLYFNSAQELRLQRGDITLICSKTGYGQTSALTTMAINDAIRNRDNKTGEVTVFINHEESRGAELILMLNNYVGIPYGRYDSGRICDIMSGYIGKRNPFFKGSLSDGTPYQVDFDKKSEEFFSLFTKDGTMRLVEGMKYKINELVDLLQYAFENVKTSCVFIDNLDLRYFSDTDLEGSLGKIKELAKKYNVAIVFAHHLREDGGLYEEWRLTYDTAIGVHVMDKRNVMYAKILQSGRCNVLRHSTAYWKWIGQCKKIVSQKTSMPL